MSTEATSAKTSETPCWSCGAPANSAHFCAACGKIQPLSGEVDYFAFFGLPRKLAIDPEDLERRFHQLSWKLHPDNFVRGGERDRELALARSSQLNDAFRALRDPISRVEYLLASAGMRREGQHKQQAPPELLEEVFELNESLDELREARQRRTSADVPAETATVRRKLEAASQNFAEKLAGVDAELEKLFAEWDNANADAGTGAAPGAGAGAGPGARLTEARAATLARDATNDATSDAVRRKLMERMNEVLNRRSYIRNLVASVQKELEGE
jgi:molecular chaperone HscB